ncbi:hypothetical protein DFP72DRAFT_843331 [Ephemerocybe angulata]|uniref:RING-type domain-containing protein n=1 Tax=Ephemerocybe angulata TaxID=980116 RepID=A0A8H6I7S7_9AGAR|nr:hypothetical protein DFP72DRAFT_843331 [Tulosesus angulatus]
MQAQSTLSTQVNAASTEQQSTSTTAADASDEHRPIALPGCGICTNLLHPIHRPAKRIICGHTYCGECVERLLELGYACPGKCRDNVPLRPRDARTLHISIAPTMEEEDDAAALSVIVALLKKRARLDGLEAYNTVQSEFISKCIANQLSTLRRFTSISKTAFTTKMDAVSELKGLDEELRVALDSENKLLSELSAVQRQLRAVRREMPELDLENYSARLSILSDVRTSLKRPAADTGDDVDNNPHTSKRARSPDRAQEAVPGPSSQRRLRSLRPLRNARFRAGAYAPILSRNHHRLSSLRVAFAPIRGIVSEPLAIQRRRHDSESSEAIVELGEYKRGSPAVWSDSTPLQWRRTRLIGLDEVWGNSARLGSREISRFTCPQVPGNVLLTSSPLPVLSRCCRRKVPRPSALWPTRLPRAAQNLRPVWIPLRQAEVVRAGPEGQAQKDHWYQQDEVLEGCFQEV